jgi:hypothetical protein
MQRLNEKTLQEFNTIDQTKSMLREKIQAAYRHNDRDIVDARARNVERFINSQTDKGNAVNYAVSYLDKLAGATKDASAKKPLIAEDEEQMGIPLKDYIWNGDLKAEEQLIDAVLFKPD